MRDSHTPDQGFQHTAARRRLRNVNLQVIFYASFNTQPPEGGCFGWSSCTPIPTAVSTHSRPKAAAINHLILSRYIPVSTHSRPKAAALTLNMFIHRLHSFNTQPPEGGCTLTSGTLIVCALFQHTAARRRLLDSAFDFFQIFFSFNTQPPEGGCSLHKKARKISRLNTVFR